MNGEGRTVTIRDQSAGKDEAARVKAGKANARHVGAPMPGKVIKVSVKPGDAVKAGQVLLVTEAMKMETNVKARADGVVAEVKFAEGGKVEKEDLLVVFQQEPGPGKEGGRPGPPLLHRSRTAALARPGTPRHRFSRAAR